MAGAYYWHRFFAQQPDLNYANPRVLDAMLQTMRFWLDLGVDGFRLDAIPYLCEREGTNNANLPETHAILKAMRRFLDQHYEDRIFLAEVTQTPTDIRAYFGEGDECHMAYHFPLVPRLFLALCQEDRTPITDVLQQTPALPYDYQWALFLRNHDAMGVKMLTEAERQRLYQAYAPEPRMLLHTEIRRRLAPLVHGHLGRIQLLHSLLLSLPGTPILYYGDEIGMGDNVVLEDRAGVRTPMQWSGDRNAGFSQADSQRLYAPVIMDPVYGYQVINVESQERDSASLLQWMQRMIALRQQLPRRQASADVGKLDAPVGGRRAHASGNLLADLGRGRRESGARRGCRCRHDGIIETILIVANVSSQPQRVELDLAAYTGLIPREMCREGECPAIGTGPYMLTLGPYACSWLRL